MTSSVKIVSACPDTLVLNCYPTDGAHEVTRRDMPIKLRAELELLKKLAQDAEESVPSRFLFRDINLKMQAKGGEGFNWILKNDDITMAVNRSSKMRLWAQVRCSSGYLQTTRNLTCVITEVDTFLKSIFGILVTLQPSAIDLAVDVVFFDIGTVRDVEEYFVSRAQLTNKMPGTTDGLIDGPEGQPRRWKRLTGLPFGARAAPLSALLYDKSHEIKYKSPEKGYMWDIWEVEAEKQGFCLLPGITRVWRDEMRYKRPALNETLEEGVFHGINDAYDLEARLPGLWSYAVGHPDGGPDGLPDGWLRYVIPSDDDTNRSRWPVHPDWRVMQSAFQPAPHVETDEERAAREQEDLASDLDAYLTAHPAALACPEVMPDTPDSTPPVEVLPFSYYRRERKRDVNLHRLIAQIAGTAITAEAWRNPADRDDGTASDISDTFHYLYTEVSAYLEQTKRDFTALVKKKRVAYDMQQTTDILDDLA